jgi:plasmid maintenance system antidote protein VapI
MQQAYDLWRVEQRLKDELATIEPAESVNSIAY